MQHSNIHRKPHSRTLRPKAVLPAAALTVALVAAGCSGDSDSGGSGGGSSGEQQSDSPDSPDSQTARLNDTGDPVAVAGTEDSTAATLSVAVSQALFASAPAVVVAQAGDAEGMKQGAEDATSLGVPMLVIDEAPDEASDAASATDRPDTDSDASQTSSAEPVVVEVDAQKEEIARLEAETVLAMGSQVESDLGDLSGAEVVTSADDVSEVTPAEDLDDLAVLVLSDEDEAARAAATASAQAAGADVVPVEGPDLRSDPKAISALADQDPARVLAVGADFGSVETLSGRVEVARTGVELPGGGQALFPGRRLVAMYGVPGTPVLGVLGEQDLDASIDRAKDLAADFDPLSDVPAVPTFEIIATVAQSSAGADGDYSGEADVADLRPWVEKAGEEGVYVVLDLQPGRANFLDQAKIYEDLLRMPHVGLALDPEWRLTPTQRPLGQIGSVEADEVNSVITWLADLTKEEKLPQKLLVLHQFRLSMLQDEDQIDVSRDEVQVLIHMDGQGSPDLKDGTWQAVVEAAPDGVPFGWKNFYDEDEPMLTPEQTMEKDPTPMMISYQ